MDFINESELQLKFDFDIAETSSHHTINYKVSGNGSITITNHFNPDNIDALPELPRFGMNMHVNKDLDNVIWYGRGPYENYWDRKTASFIGIYESNVDDLFEEYASVQETGNRCDNRWIYSS